MSPTAILFDFGNVIAFFDHMRACRRLAGFSWEEMSGEEVYERVFVRPGPINHQPSTINHQQPSLEEQYDSGLITTDAFLDALNELLHLEVSHKHTAKAWSNIFEPNHEVIQVIPELKQRGLRIILASNTNELHCDWFRESFADTLRHFDAQICSHEVGCRKPDHKFYERCLEAADCAPEECVYFDDRADLVAAACELGIKGVVYVPGMEGGIMSNE
jgi:HAD superfamily hydrolase (TIGR01509 family)